MGKSNFKKPITSITLNEAIEAFKKWCSNEKVSVFNNEESFFITENRTIKPALKTLSGLFVDITEPSKNVDDVLYQGFANSFGIILIIPKHLMMEFVKRVSKEALEQYFEINIK